MFPFMLKLILMLKNLCFFNSYFFTCYHFTISLTWTDSITSAGSVALYWPNSMNRFMSRICYVLIAHIMYLFYFYSSSYNLFINWGQNWGQDLWQSLWQTCDVIFWRDHMQQFLYLVFGYHLTSSSSFLQGIVKTSFGSALASFVSWLFLLIEFFLSHQLLHRHFKRICYCNESFKAWLGGVGDPLGHCSRILAEFVG